jgi:hypothetical protein
VLDPENRFPWNFSLLRGMFITSHSAVALSGIVNGRIIRLAAQRCLGGPDGREELVMLFSCQQILERAIPELGSAYYNQCRAARFQLVIGDNQAFGGQIETDHFERHGEKGVVVDALLPTPSVIAIQSHAVLTAPNGYLVLFVDLGELHCEGR